MSHGHHIDGPALRALAAGPSSFLPPQAEPAEKPRDRIWELADTLHCSIVGTCLTEADARAVLVKLGRPDARTLSEHRLHGEVVQVAGRRDGGGRLLQKALDRRHDRAIRRFAEARTADAVRALWREALEGGAIPGAYWAAITHPATDWPLVQDIFGEVHMLSHRVGQSNRADLRRLRQLDLDLAERDDTIARQERRIHDLIEQRDAQARAAEVAGTRVAALPVREPDCARETVAVLESRLARERAHAEALEEKVAILMQAATRLGVDLETETARARAAEAELAALESTLDGEPDAGSLGPADGLALRTVLYVGGRPRHVANLRRFAEARGGRLLSHDGGLEEALSLLPGLVGQSDLVVFPVPCVSHEATAWVRRACEAGGIPVRPLRSASLASFVQAVMAEPVPGPSGRPPSERRSAT